MTITKTFTVSVSVTTIVKHTIKVRLVMTVSVSVTMIVTDTIKVRLVMTVTVTITGRARLGETGRATVTETETVA